MTGPGTGPGHDRRVSGPPPGAAGTDEVELLERAIAYARGALCGVDDRRLDLPTPCREWSLGALLEHMSDGLDAFTEASRGVIRVASTTSGGPPVVVLRDKACTLLGAWTSPAAAEARLGDQRLRSATLLGAAALEITVHGWDVGQATGVGNPLPVGLASMLLPVAEVLVTEADRNIRFAGPRGMTAQGWPDPATGLLGFLGREPHPSLPLRRTPWER